MIRDIVKIDKEKCTGCGLCVTSCVEGAIKLINGKAELIRDDYCDGLGKCLPSCPANAISIEKREAAEFDEIEVKKYQDSKISDVPKHSLNNWPIQIKLAPVQSNVFHDADLLIASSCSGFSYSNFHADFIKNKVCLIGCSKLDGVDYSDKLSQILKYNDIKSITLVLMEVPCCKGLERMVNTAMFLAKKNIPLTIYVISLKGEILNVR